MAASTSWGPDDTLEVTLILSEANEILIYGLGDSVAGSTDNHSIYDDVFQLYINSTQGPLLVANPGNTYKSSFLTTWKLMKNANISAPPTCR